MSCYEHAQGVKDLGQTVSAAGIQTSINQPAREPLLMAFMMSLHATLWHSVIKPDFCENTAPREYGGHSLFADSVDTEG